MSDYPISTGSGISNSLQSDSPLSSDHMVNSPQSICTNSPQSLYSSSPNSQFSTQGNYDPCQYAQVPNVGQNYASPSFIEGGSGGQNYSNYVGNVQQHQTQQHVQHYVDQLHHGLHQELQQQQPFHISGHIDSNQQQLQQHEQQIENVLYQPNQNPTGQLQAQVSTQNIQWNQSLQNQQDLLPNLVWKILPAKSFRYRYLTEKGGHGFLSGEMKNTCPTIELQNYSGSVEFSVHLYARETSLEEPHSILRILQETDVKQNRHEIKDILKEEVIFNGSNSYQSVTCELRGISIIKLTKEDLQRLGKDLEEAANLVRKFNKSSVCLRVEARNPNTGRLIASPVFSRCINNERGAGGKLRILRRSMYTCPVEGNEELWILSDPVKKNDIEVIISDGYDWKKKCNNLEIFHQHLIICRIPPFDKERITEPSSMQLLLYRPSDDTWSDFQEIKYLPTQSDYRKRKRPNIQYPQGVPLQQYPTQSQTQTGSLSPPMQQEWNISPNYGTDNSAQSGDELQFNFFISDLLKSTSSNDLTTDGSDLLKSTSSNDLTTDGTGTETRSTIENVPKLSINEYDDQGFSGLHTAILNGMTKEVSYLLSRGASVNLPVKLTGDNPLIIAVKFDHAQIIQLLLDADDIELDVKNCAGETAIDILENGSEAIKIFQSHEKTKNLNISPIQHDKNGEANEGNSYNELLDSSEKQIPLVNNYEDFNDTDIHKEDSKAIHQSEISNDTDIYKEDSEVTKHTEISNDKSKDRKIRKDSLTDMDESNLGFNSTHFYFYCFFPVFLAYYFWVIYYNK